MEYERFNTYQTQYIQACLHNSFADKQKPNFEKIAEGIGKSVASLMYKINSSGWSYYK